MQKRIDDILEGAFEEIDAFLDHIESDVGGPPPGLKRIPNADFQEYVEKQAIERGPPWVADLPYERGQDTIKRFRRLSGIDDVVGHLDKLIAAYQAEQMMRSLNEAEGAPGRGVRVVGR